MKNEIPEAKSNLLSPAGSDRAKWKIPALLEALSRYVPFLLTAGILSILGWAGLGIVQHPYSGLTWSYKSGVISQVDPQSPAAGLFKVGDRILAIDGVSPYQAHDLPDRKVDDRVAFSVERGQEILSIHLRLAKPGLPRVLTNLTTILVALSFWLLGTLVLVFGPPGKLVRNFFLFSQAFTLILGLGSVSSYGPLWSGWVFNLLLWWIGPLAIHTHLLLANSRISNHQDRILRFLYALALIFSLVDLVRLYLGTPGLLLTTKYLWLGLTLLGAIGVLFIASRHNAQVDLRRKTRIAGLAAFIAILPFVIFSLIPDALFDQKILPYEMTFLALPILPLGYSYAILRCKLIHIERYVNRGAAYTLIILFVGALYGLVYMASLRMLRSGRRPRPGSCG